ncbi:high-affinity nitrate transporter 3.1 [Malania oleifera]|uniref:high-affinity nitrate transporter 3.1 n=1 Tax=Malania oleifera TaxID=397392 RepID=UPI0025AE87B8|nr:high-affinity nitrate transporter 3.1 [Malania oleifera]
MTLLLCCIKAEGKKSNFTIIHSSNGGTRGHHVFAVCFCPLISNMKQTNPCWRDHFNNPMSTRGGLLLASLLLCCLAGTCHGVVSFSSLQRTLLVTASPTQGQVLKGGEDNITVTWVLNQTYSESEGTDSAYNTVKVKLCFAPISQVDRAWRKTEDNLNKDKTCQFIIVTRPYNPSNRTVQSFVWTVERDVPTATYFVRAYAFNSQGEEVGYGQSTDDKKTTNLFNVEAISGRHASLDIAAACFSAFSVVSLFGFFVLEKRKAKMAEKK